jgi:lipopolysaccharide/colanic/teichoic acid biosynthesis glycosyltransferase
MLGQAQHALKRLLDLVLAAVGIVVLSPLLVAIALAVLFTSGRPVFYPWLVVGKRGRNFVGYKFRTMVRNADKQLELLAAKNEMKGPAFKMKEDPRVTPVGRVLRRLSLDELPQLWSVLKGDMSLVGPRPPLRTEWARFAPWQRRKLAVTPGITCLWQISGRADINEFDNWVKLDIEYIERWSLWLDLKILVGTLGAVARGRGAY